MKRKLLFGGMFILFLLLFPSVCSIEDSIIDESPYKIKYLVIGFFPDIRQDDCFYYLIPGVLWAQINFEKVIVLWLGTFFILGISDVRPNFWLGKMP
jgi:hypothetical protein